MYWVVRWNPDTNSVDKRIGSWVILPYYIGTKGWINEILELKAQI